MDAIHKLKQMPDFEPTITYSLSEMCEDSQRLVEPSRMNGLMDEIDDKLKLNTVRMNQRINGRVALTNIINRKFVGLDYSFITNNKKGIYQYLVVEGRHFSVSISHSLNISIAVLADGIHRVGIDVEHKNRISQLTLIEKVMPRDIEKKRDLLERWIVKEAVIKATNLGAALDPKNYYWQGNKIWLANPLENKTIEINIVLWKVDECCFALATY